MPALRRIAAAALAVCALTACAGAPEPTPVTEPPANACAVYESSDWAAWINAMPGPGAQRTLHVTGRIVVPTPNYTATLTAGIADRSAIPVQQINLNLTTTDGMALQVLTPLEVRYEGPAIAQNYRAIRIMCGGRAIAEITEIETAH